MRLAPAYVREYTEEILDLVGLPTVVSRLPVHGLGALMCVETSAAACHRSLVAARLAERFDLQVIDLDPPA